MDSDWKDKDWAEITYEDFRSNDHRPVLTHVRRAVERVWPYGLYLVNSYVGRPLWRPLNLLLITDARELYIGSDPQTVQSFVAQEPAPSFPQLRVKEVTDFRWYIHFQRHKLNKMTFTVTFPTDSPDHRLLLAAFDAQFFRKGEVAWQALLT